MVSGRLCSIMQHKLMPSVQTLLVAHCILHPTHSEAQAFPHLSPLPKGHAPDSGGPDFLAAVHACRLQLRLGFPGRHEERERALDEGHGCRAHHAPLALPCQQMQDLIAIHSTTCSCEACLRTGLPSASSLVLKLRCLGSNTAVHPDLPLSAGAGPETALEAMPLCCNHSCQACSWWCTS